MGLIHRDIKPANVWLEGSRQWVKLLDFGMARHAHTPSQLTNQGVILETPQYMAPEQARGGEVDGRCDLFSLGIILDRLCAGRLPFQGESVFAILTSLAVDSPMPPTAVRPDVPPRPGRAGHAIFGQTAEDQPSSAKLVEKTLCHIERELGTACAEPGA